MRANVVILSGGMSGSSVLTGLIASSGYWAGHETAKTGYETWENSQLIRLNRRILLAAGHDWESPPSGVLYPNLDAVRQCVAELDLEPFRDFVEECEKHSPFIWKDPRVVYTMEVWAEFLDLSTLKIIVADRDFEQMWTGQILRPGTYYPRWKLREMQQHSVDTSIEFCRARGLDALTVSFEDLIVDTDATLARLNEYLGLHLKLDDLRNTYSGELGRLRWSRWDHHKALLKSLWLRLRD